MNIIKDHIKSGLANRPNTNPASSLYQRVIEPEFIVYHNPAWPGGSARTIHLYGKKQYVRPNLKSWNYSVDKDDIYEMVPVGEATWQAGDNLGPGNTNSISMEVCDRGAYAGNWDLFWEDQNNAARLCAYLIKTVPSLRPYPECLKQHHYFSGKNCPAWLRNNSGWWQRLVDMVGEYLEVSEITKPVGSGDIWLTAGSYKVIENALSVSNDLSLIGQASQIRQVEVGGVNYYRVVVGYFSTRTEAVKLQNELKAKGFNTTIIDTNPQEEPEEKPEDPGSELPAGLMDLLRQLYELLKKLFGG